MSVAEKIKRERQKKGFTQKELGEKCGIAESTLRHYELGIRNPKLSTIEKIANALTIPSYILLSRENSQLARNERLIAYFEALNELGKEKIEKQLEELSSIPEYRKNYE